MGFSPDSDDGANSSRGNDHAVPNIIGYAFESQSLLLRRSRSRCVVPDADADLSRPVDGSGPPGQKAKGVHLWTSGLSETTAEREATTFHEDGP